MTKFLICVSLFFAAATACAGGDEAPAGSPIVGDIDPAIVAAIRDYMATSGIEGDVSFILSEPPDCVTLRAPRQAVHYVATGRELRIQSALHGLLCIVRDKSTMSDQGAVITLALDGVPDITWKMELDQNSASGAWRVTSVKFTGG